MNLFYKTYGNEGPPLLVLHGLLGDHSNWHTLNRTVFQNVAQVYALDQRNHGRSPQVDRIDYPSMADDIRSFMKKRKLETATLLGHSMGGKTAMQFALANPERVDRLIVVDMAPRAYAPHHTPLLEALAQIDLSAYDDRDEVDAVLAEEVPSRPIRQFLLKNLKHNGDQYEWVINLEAIRGHYDDIVAAIEGETAYEGPALFVRGADSDYVRDEDVHDIRTLFPNAKLETIDGAGHWVHADQPEALADVVTYFLSTSETTAIRKDGA